MFIQVLEIFFSCTIFIGSINSLALSLGGKYIVTASDDRCIKIFDLKTKQELHCLKFIHDGTF